MFSKKKYFCLLLSAAALSMLLFTGCPLPGTDDEPDTGSEYPLGANKTPSAILTGKLASVLPPSQTSVTALLLAPTVPVGNQGRQGSCVAWASSYCAKTILTASRKRLDATLTAVQFSPSWVYNQINGGVDGGAYVSSACELLKMFGCDTLDNFPYTDSNYTNQPNSASLARAYTARISNYYNFAPTSADIKQVLQAGYPVILVIEVRPDFDGITETNQIYDSSAGSVRGYHAICAIGYDDDKQAVLIENSWGTSWGIPARFSSGGSSSTAGYGWIAYSLFDNSNTNGMYFEAWYLVPGLATVTCQAASDLTPTSVTLNGTLFDMSDAAVTEHGFKYGTDQNNLDTTKSLGAASAEGTFSTSITGLTTSATYYVKSYAITEYGTTESLPRTFIPQ